MKLISRHIGWPAILSALLSLAVVMNSTGSRPLKAADNTATDWSAYGRDSGGSRYSPLSQINRDNVSKLAVAWTYRTGALNQESVVKHKAAFEATPILTDGTLYLSTPYNRVIALDPETGRERWAFDSKPDKSIRFSEVTSRGVSTWLNRSETGNHCRRRIFVATIDARLIALDATSGELCKSFGQNGQVDLTRDIRFQDVEDYQVTSPPAVIANLVIVGSSIGDNRGVEVERGTVRAYDAESGKLRWFWDPIPRQASDSARKTWRGNSALRTGAANAWSLISSDPERDLVFIPTSSPSPDFYGGERLGNNLYANSVVALRASTGKLVWHFQVVHHDLWDYDVAAQPLLLNVTRNGRDIPAVAIGTKMGHVFLLNRGTGKPIFPVEERIVPRSTVTGEVSSPTQPFPVLPQPLIPQRITAADAWGATPADRDWCRDRIIALRSEGPFTPPSLEGTIVFPGNSGGINWSGMSHDPKKGLLITNMNRVATVVRLIPREEFQRLQSTGEDNRFKGEFARQEGTPYAMHREGLVTPSGIPCNAPPWGVLTAIDLATGKVKWEVPLGTNPRMSAYPESANWGSTNIGGSIVTAGGLVFISAARDNYFRAFDIDTGKELWKWELPASAQATPMTYQVSQNGKQYVVISAGGHGKMGTKPGDYVVAFALP